MNLEKITIIGVGLLGSSFALSLKRVGSNAIITGVGRNEENLQKAEELGIIDEYCTVPADGVAGADLVLLATPVGQFENIVSDIRHELKKGAIVTDVGSVKGGLVGRLDALMPEGVSFVGAHPIAGGERQGLEAATSELFWGAKCIITPTPDTDKDALEDITELWKQLGARVLHMTPDEHDEVYSAVSHLPHVLAYALVNSISSIREDILDFGGRGLKDMTRIALSPTELWKDICSQNRDHMLRSLNDFSSNISGIIKRFEKSDWKGLEEEFKRAKEARQRLESD
ncbi:MAG: prephenate dehydrogenase/arogenate dehydrogenase family protein [Thermodesulfovibrionia bacterium]|nr:prephenate dehydrogenase/arogenate dehydrogenase family protein [Thermodesulfovibrionia bacterium]